jgi:outer membrane protein assembly factor BamB
VFTISAVLFGLNCGDRVADPHPVSPRRIAWRVDGRGGGTPSYDSTTVYFVGWKHEVLGIDKRTGTVRWRNTMSAAGEFTAGFNSIVASGIVAVVDDGVHAFDSQTGARRWAFRPAEDEIGTYLATDGHTVYAGSLTGRVYAIDATTGAERWAPVVSTEPEVKTLRPTVEGGVVYVGVKQFLGPAAGALAALDAVSGAVRWIHQFAPESSALGAGCSGGAVFFGGAVLASVQDGRIFALDRATGITQWVAPRLTNLPPGTGGSPENDERPLVVAGSFVIAGSSTGYLAAYDAVTGLEQWRATANFGSAVYPLVADDSSVYVTHLGGQLAAIDVLTGAVRWVAGSRRMGGDFTLSPAVDEHYVYAGGPGGYYALHKD